MAAILTTVIFGVILFLIWKIVTSYIKMLMTNLPGPTPLPIIGNAHIFKADEYNNTTPLLNFAEVYKQHGLYRAFFCTHTVIALTRSDTVEKILTSSTLITKPFLYGFVEPWLGNGLLMSTGEKWQKRRKQITPAFHFRILQDFINVFNEQSTVLVEQLAKDHMDGKPFDISDYVTKCTLDILSETAMGTQLKAQTEKYSKYSTYIDAVQRICELLVARMKLPLYWPQSIFNLTPIGMEFAKLLKILHAFTNQVISERRENFNKNKFTPPSSSSAAKADAVLSKKKIIFLDMLLAAEGADKLTNEDLREEVDTFMFEGHDTTASALKWAIYLIGKHKDVHEKLYQEIKSIFGMDRNRWTTMDDMNSMKYLEAVVKETLRLYPPVPIFARELTEDIVINDFKVQREATILVLVQAVHRNALDFPDPNSFNPDRWLNQQTTKNPFAFIPFSAGKRNCIGQKYAMFEIKVILLRLLRHYIIESTQESKMKPEIVLRPKKEKSTDCDSALIPLHCVHG